MLHEILNSLFVGVVGICFWIFKLHYSRHLALVDAEKKSRSDELTAIRKEIAELRADLAHDGTTRKTNGVDSQDDAPGGRPRNRLRGPRD